MSAMTSDLCTGALVGRWTLLEERQGPRGRTQWRCRCACGVIHFVDAPDLKRGKSRSCGCLKHETWMRRVTIHGGYGTAEHQAWRSMIDRCRDLKEPYHGALGVKVCSQWLRSFPRFLADVGPRPSPRHSLDRYPNCNGNYEPGNVRWATPQEQARNTRGGRYVTLNGERRLLIEWCELYGTNYTTALHRLRKGWTPDRAIRTTAQEGRQQGWKAARATKRACR